jgi:hypothetical protein
MATLVATNVKSTALSTGRTTCTDTAGNRYILAAPDATNTLHVFRSTDQGASWTDTGFPAIPNNGGLYEYGILAGLDGTVHVYGICSESGSPGNASVFWCRWTGASWAAPIKPIAAINTLGGNLSATCTANSGHYAIAYTRNPGTGFYNVWIATSVDGGLSFTTSLPSPMNRTGQNQNPRIAVDPSSNRLIVVVQEYFNGGGVPYVLAYISGPDEGASWPSLTQLSSQSGGFGADQPDVTVDEKGYYYACWRQADASNSGTQIQVSRLAGFGGSWSAPVDVTNLGGNAQSEPSIQSDRAGGVHLVCYGSDSSWPTQTVVHYTKSVNNGVNWAALSALKTPIGTGNNLSLASLANPAASRLGYAWLEGQGGGQTYSLYYDQFTVNQAPLAPTLVPRAGFDATQAAEFDWTFHDPDPLDTQSAFQMQIIRVSDGVTVIDTGQVASTLQKGFLGPNTLVNGTTYQWQVRTWDNNNAVGPYSARGQFTCTAAPTALVTSPANGASVTNNRLTIKWSYSSPNNLAQQTYRLQLFILSSVVFDTGVVTDANARSATLNYTLLNNTVYTIVLTVTDTNGTANAPVNSYFGTNFSLPLAPSLTATPDPANGRVILTPSNPVADPAHATPTTVELFRRRLGDTTWTRIVKGVPSGGSVAFSRSTGSYKDDSSFLDVNSPRYENAHYAKGLYVEQAAFNSVSNPSFETDLTGWTLTPATGGSHARVNASPQIFGPWCLSIANGSGAGSKDRATVNLSAGNPYTASVYFFADAATSVTLSLISTDGSTVLGSVTATGNGAWQRIAVSATATVSGNNFVELKVNTANKSAQFDAVQVEFGPFASTFTDVFRDVTNAVLPASLIPASPNPFTIEFWALTRQSGAYHGPLYVWAGSGQNGGNRFFVDLDSGNTVRLSYLDASGVQQTVYGSGPIASPTAAHHWAITCDGTTTRVYLDGVQQLSAATSLPKSADVINLGNLPNTNFWNGWIESFVIYDYAKTGAQILADVSAPAPAIDSHTRALATFNQTLGVQWAVPALADAAAPGTSDASLTIEYFVRAVTDNGTVADSAVVDTALQLDGIWLFAVNDPAGTIHQFLDDLGTRGEQFTPELATLQYAGRNLPVAVFSGRFQRTIHWGGFARWGNADYAALRALSESLQTVCYRDHRGRQAFGVIQPQQIEDDLARYTFSQTLLVTDYSEAV